MGIGNSRWGYRFSRFSSRRGSGGDDVGMLNSPTGILWGFGGTVLCANFVKDFSRNLQWRIQEQAQTVWNRFNSRKPGAKSAVISSLECTGFW